MVPLLFQCVQLKSQLCNTISETHSFIKFSNKIFAIAHWLLMAIIKGMTASNRKALELICLAFHRWEMHSEQNSLFNNSPLGFTEMNI